MSTTATPAMPLRAALEVLRDVRREEVVVTTMGPAREWAAISNHPLDFCHIPSCMGHTSAIGLGLALAQPTRQVIVLNGDGSMLMSLGNLVTIAGANDLQSLGNFTLVLCDNGVYEVTGRQRTPGRQVDFVGLAKAAGFERVWRFDDLDAWRGAVQDVLAGAGPRFVHLCVEPVWEEQNLQVPVREPITSQIARLKDQFFKTARPAH
jgi:thiamine pyrophosphate-dependent acetolactate synthase large subunit-like protein